MIYAFGRGDLSHLAMKLEGDVHPPTGFDLVENGGRKHAEELYLVMRERTRQATERAIKSAELKAKEVKIW